MQVCPRARRPHDRGSAADVIDVRVGQDETLQVGWRAPELPDRVEDDGFLLREAGIDERQPVVAVDEIGVRVAHGDAIDAFDETAHGHRLWLHSIAICRNLHCK